MRRFLSLLGFALHPIKRWLWLALVFAGMHLHAQVINCSSGFTLTGSGACSVNNSVGAADFVLGSPTLSGTAIILAPTGAGHQGNCLIRQTKVNVQAFTAVWTFKMNGLNHAFVVENQSNQNGQAFCSGAGGEGGFSQSAGGGNIAPNFTFAMMLDAYSPLTEAGSFTHSSAQWYESLQTPAIPIIGGGSYLPEFPTTKLSTSPVPLNSPATTQFTYTGDTYSATLTYDGYTLTLNMFDVTAGGSCPGASCYTQAWTGVYIPSIVGATTAWVGFTAGTSGGAATSTTNLDIDTFTYTVNTPTGSPSYTAYNANSTYNTGVSSAASPVYSVAPGTYAGTQSVTITTSTTPNNYICYTLSATVPTLYPHPDNNGGCSAGTLYTGPISISSTSTLYAMAGSNNSAFATGSQTPTGLGPPSTLVAGAYTIGASGAGAPTLAFSAIPNETYGAAPFAASATSNSPGAITYSVVSGPATISGSTVTITGVGSVTLQASQAASGSYTTATATTSFTVSAAAPSLSFTAIPSQTYGVAPLTAAATSNSTGAITYSVVSGPATISGSTVTITGVGFVTLQARQAATTNYTAATVTTSFSVAGETPNFTFAAIPNQTYGVAAFTVSATSNSPGAISYLGSSGPASLSGNVVTITGIGTVTLTADQVASGNYAAGTATISFSVAAATPTLSFLAIANQTYGVAPFPVSATSNSTGAITYSVVGGPATISGNTVTLTGAGTVTLQASQVAAGNYAATTATKSFTVSAEATTLAFVPVQGQTYGVAPFAVSATSNSTGAISYSVVSGPATISGNTVTITGVGTVILQASQVAAGGYPAATATANFSVAAATPTLSFASISNQTYGVAPFAVSTTSNSTGAITYSVVNGPATISGSTVTITGAGTVTLRASQAAAGNYATTTATISFTVAAATPTLSFAAVPNQTYGVTPFAVSATSNSTGTITYSVISGPATISGSTVTITGAGTVNLQAIQAAAGGYAATTATTSFNVGGVTPTLTFASIPNQAYGVAPFAVSATSNSTGAITYSVISGSATIAGNTVTITGPGTVTLQANQPAAGGYTAATARTSFNVSGVTPTLTFASIPNQTYGVAPFAVSATSTSTGAITYSVISGPATISGNIVTITGAGTVTLQASQAAAGVYPAATTTIIFSVAAATPTLRFASIPNQTYGVAPFPVSATSNSTGAITYSVIGGPATISGNAATLTGSGTVTLQASQAAAGNYATATATTSFSVSGATPTLTFATIQNRTYGAAPFTVVATSTSTGAITYSVISGPATILGSTVTTTGAGTVTLQASQAAAGGYAATTATTSFNVSGATTLSFAAIPNQTYGAAPFAVVATSTSTGAITYSVISGPATILGSTVTTTGAGTVTLQASQAAAGGYAATTATTSFNVSGATTLSFAAIPNQTYGAAPFAVSATSNSTGAITYSVISGPATISGKAVSLTGVGTVNLQASQAAAGGYPAATVTTSFNVLGATPTLTFASIPNQTYGVAPFTVLATSNSPAAINYSVISGQATISGSTVKITGSGTVILQASQAAAGGYAAATVTTTFTVSGGASPTLTFFPIQSQPYGGSPFTVSATSNSTGAITYSVISGPATLSGNMVTLTGAGTITLQASQTAAGGYAAATATANLISTSGSVWIGNGNSSLSTFDLSGDAISGSSGLTGGGIGSIAGPLGLAIDSSGDVWVANGDGVSEFSQQGVPMTSTAYTSGGITNPVAVAVDGAGQMWVANSNGTVSVLSNTGTAVSPSTGYSGTGGKPAGIAIDITGSVWIPSSTGSTVTRILGATAPVVPLASGSATEPGAKP
jgi:hypothetical protein